MREILNETPRPLLPTHGNMHASKSSPRLQGIQVEQGGTLSVSVSVYLQPTGRASSKSQDLQPVLQKTLYIIDERTSLMYSSGYAYLADSAG